MYALSTGEVVIGPTTDGRSGPVVGRFGGRKFARGAVPRDFSVQPRPMQAVAFDLIPRAEWSERVRDKIAAGSQLSDVRSRADNGQPIKSYDQNGQGYCWAYSTTAALTLARACSGLPHVRLSAHSVAWKIKKGRDEGGWCGLSMEFLQATGVMPESVWPAKYMGREKDTAANWEAAKAYSVTEGWVDLDAQVYDRNLTFDQVATLYLSNTPCAVDFNWWGHSVCGCDLVDGAQQRQTTRGADGKLLSLEAFDALWGMNDGRTAGFGQRIWNSWTDTWGAAGMGVLAGSKAVPDGAVGIVTANA